MSLLTSCKIIHSSENARSCRRSIRFYWRTFYQLEDLIRSECGVNCGLFYRVPRPSRLSCNGGDVDKCRSPDPSSFQDPIQIIFRSHLLYRQGLLVVAVLGRHARLRPPILWGMSINRAAPLVSIYIVLVLCSFTHFPHNPSATYCKPRRHLPPCSHQPCAPPSSKQRPSSFSHRCSTTI